MAYYGKTSAELRKYFYSLQDKFGETSRRTGSSKDHGGCRSKRVNWTSLECARVTGRNRKKYYIDGMHAYDLPYQESPPIQMLAQSDP